MKKIITLFFIIAIIIHSPMGCKKAHVVRDRYVVSLNGIIVKSEPNEASNTITSIPFGMKVKSTKSIGEECTIANEKGKWEYIEYNDKKGWVFGGFLRDYNPSDIQKVAAEYYNEQYNKWYGKEQLENFPRLFNQKERDIKIRDINGDYFIIHHYIPSKHGIKTYWSKAAIWKWDTNFKELIDIGSDGVLYSSHSKFVQLNNDEYIDAINVIQLGDGMYTIQVLYGNKNGFQEVYASKDDFHGGNIRFIKLGSCNNTMFAYSTSNEGGPINYYYHFDCTMKQFKKCKESKDDEKIDYIDFIIFEEISD